MNDREKSKSYMELEDEALDGVIGGVTDGDIYKTAKAEGYISPLPSIEFLVTGYPLSPLRCNCDQKHKWYTSRKADLSNAAINSFYTIKCFSCGATWHLEYYHVSNPSTTAHQ